jgi:hypothetical protein
MAQYPRIHLQTLRLENLKSQHNEKPQIRQSSLSSPPPPQKKKKSAHTALNIRWFIISIWRWALFRGRPIFHTHDVSVVGSIPVFRWLVIIVLTHFLF